MPHVNLPNKMGIGNEEITILDRINQIIGSVASFLRRYVFTVLLIGSIPNHIAFIMDGNRRYAKKRRLAEGAGHRVGYLALMSMLKYCYELGVKYVTVYAFSIDNFKRSPEEVQSVMDLMLEKIQVLIKEDGIVNQYGVRVYFLGNLKLLSEPLRQAVEKAMAATKNNNRAVLSICVAYSSTDEIVHAVEKSCEEKWDLNANDSLITSTDLEKHMYMAVIPDPDILIRTSAETRLSNFLLWQTSFCYLYSPYVLWPEINFWHFIWAILNFQRNHLYLVKKRKQL